MSPPNKFHQQHHQCDEHFIYPFLNMGTVIQAQEISMLMRDLAKHQPWPQCLRWCPILQEWIDEIARHIDDAGRNLFVGHSLGSAAICDIWNQKMLDQYQVLYSYLVQSKVSKKRIEKSL